MEQPTCGHCDKPASQRDGRHWCAPCGIWLIHCDLSGQWVGYAEHEHRRKQADNATIIEASRLAVQEVLDSGGIDLPPGWRAESHQSVEGACYALNIHPPADCPLDVHAYLIPPNGGYGWHVAVHNKTRGVGFPLYTDGGAHAAQYPSAIDAVAAAVGAVKGQIFDDQQHRRYRQHPRQTVMPIPSA